MISKNMKKLLISNFKFNSSSLRFATFKNFSLNIQKVRKDYYQVLGLPRTASDEEIKTAYRNLAKKYHPDVHIGKTVEHEPNIEKFRDIAEAYAVLSNKTMRLDYDMRNREFPDSVFNAEK
jgi:DnaJ-class molecular chaperone